MPNTPRVDFRFENNNIQASVPLLGVSHVVACTTKGPANDPSLILNSYAQFQNVFGEEIVPDGSISNIQKAFELGSRMRVSRVLPFGATQGYAGTTENITQPTSAEKITFMFKKAGEENKEYSFLIRTKNTGEEIVTGGNYDLVFQYSSQGIPLKVTLSQKAKDGTVLSNPIPFINFINLGSEGTTIPNLKSSVDLDVLQNFINTVPYIELVPATEGFTSTDQMMVDMRKYATNADLFVNIGDSILTSGYTKTMTLNMYQGNSGSGYNHEGPWKNAFDALEDYNDGYQTILSHIHMHMIDSSMEFLNVYAHVGKKITNHFESVLYVEIPKELAYEEDPITDMTNFTQSLMSIMGFSKNICYFGGGIKYYNNSGVLQNCDVLGTVIGLGDASASKYGPWFSFSGMNRGVVYNALGPVMPNLGTPSKIEDLQSLAEWCINLFVVKDTSTRGKQTMLWHGFTSNPINSSDKFLSITRLNLYIKKNLRPILESFLEEPNTWDTWRSIYYLGRTVMDDLVNNRAMTSYEWLGDQDAKSYGDLQINNEADVRQGKYKIVLKYKDIVTLQEITMDVVIDSASQDVSISVNE